MTGHHYAHFTFKIRPEIKPITNKQQFGVNRWPVAWQIYPTLSITPPLYVGNQNVYRQPLALPLIVLFEIICLLSNIIEIVVLNNNQSLKHRGKKV